MITKGEMHVLMKDGKEYTAKAGDVYTIPPGTFLFVECFFVMFMITTRRRERDRNREYHQERQKTQEPA